MHLFCGGVGPHNRLTNNNCQVKLVPKGKTQAIQGLLLPPTTNPSSYQSSLTPRTPTFRHQKHASLSPCCWMHKRLSQEMMHLGSVQSPTTPKHTSITHQRRSAAAAFSSAASSAATASTNVSKRDRLPNKKACSCSVKRGHAAAAEEFFRGDSRAAQCSSLQGLHP